MQLDTGAAALVPTVVFPLLMFLLNCLFFIPLWCELVSVGLDFQAPYASAFSLVGQAYRWMVLRLLISEGMHEGRKERSLMA